jgi:hypothetical protein
MKIRHLISCSITLLATGLLCFNVAVAKGPSGKVTVTNADPNSALQGQVVRGVKISGSGFDKGSRVKFLVTGTKDDTQISVDQDSVSPNADGTMLTVDIVVSGEATVIDYDIEVQVSSGRRGKGTTLFKVQQEAVVVYTAVLTLGGFTFDPVDVTHNHVDNSLRGESTLQMIRPVEPGLEQYTWDDVFGPCLLLPDGVDSFRVGAINWKIVNSGDSEGLILIRMSDLDIAPEPADMSVDIGLGLARDLMVGDDPFLPEVSGDKSYFNLTHFRLQGDARQGRTCREKGGKHPGFLPLLMESELAITRK